MNLSKINLHVNAQYLCTSNEFAMTDAHATKIIARWIFLGIAMLVIQVLLGGVTRLTGSGLSITEWKPIMGALPPLSEDAWQKSFAQYQQIAQFKYLNNHFTLGDYKLIYFWEWFHRLWARLIGVVFLIPFIYFIVKKYFKQWMIHSLIVLFVLGVLQGLIGWIMVKSGLNDENLYVSHIKLAIHFISAMVLIAYAVVFGMMLITKKEERVAASGIRNFTIAITGIVVLQLLYGAFMAGLKAAASAPTWPSINGDIIPAGILSGDVLHNVFFDRITIHFIHRGLAYVLLALIFIQWWKVRKINSSAVFNRIKNLPLILVLLQALLGILSVLNSPKIVLGSFGIFEWFALFHQLVGMLVLLSLIAVIYLFKPSKV